VRRELLRNRFAGGLLPFVALFSLAASPATKPAVAKAPQAKAVKAAAPAVRKPPAASSRKARGRVPAMKTGGEGWASSPAFVPGPEGPIVGVPVEGDAGVAVTMEDLVARDVVAGRSPRVRPLKKEHEVERDDLPQNPDSPAVSRWPPRPGEAAFRAGSGESHVAALAPQTLGVQVAGPTLSDTGAYPPDTMGAVGPTQFIVAVNGRIRSYDKSTGAADGVMNFDMDVFFSSVTTPPGAGNITFTSDPRIRFDRLTNRWIVLIIDVTIDATTGDLTVPNRLLVAVSDTATITGSTVWTFFQFQADGTNFADYPTLGIDADALYVGMNMFTLPGSFVNTNGYVIRKSSILGAGPIVWTKFAGLATGTGAGPFTPQGVDNPDPANTGATAAGYFIGVDNATFGTLMLRRVTDPGGASPTMSANISLTVPSTTYPANVRHLGNTGGTNGYLDALDDRLFAATIRNGRLWTAHSIGVNNAGTAVGSNARNGARWYEIQNLATTPALVQVGTLYDNSGTATDVSQRNYWIPSIMVSGQGHAALGSSIAGTNERINGFTTGRLAGDTLGTLRDGPGGTAFPGYTASSTAYNPAGENVSLSGPRRWGDYSYTSLDPCDDMTMWTIQEFCGSSNSYRVQAVQLLAPPPATPSCGTPTDVGQGAVSVSVPITGTSTNGSGFYDTPSTGMPPCRRRLSASVSGTGVTVNGVTYTDPTHVTLNVSVTAGAAAGLRTVTITNPDGQSTTGSCLNVVTSGCATVTAAVSGGATVCSGTSTPVTVTVSGGTPPFSVTLTNGGGTQTGTSPLTFSVSPSSTTTYAVLSGNDASLCPVTGNGSAIVTVDPKPATPVITTGPVVGPGSPNRVASVPNHAGSTYAWGITNGTITSGQGTSTITYTAGTTGTLTLAVVETVTATTCSSDPGTATVTVAATGSAVAFYPLTPCRVIDTRNAAGPLGGPVLAAGPSNRKFAVTGHCGIPATAKAISANVSVTDQTVAGSLRVYQGSLVTPPGTNVISFQARKLRSNNGIVGLATDGAGTVAVQNDAPGPVQFILDVNGYFE